jgi:hypothetical protein
MRLHHEPGAAAQLDKSKSSNLGSTGGPVEMKHYDKIPRTPIDPALLEQIKRDNVRDTSINLYRLYCKGTMT